MVGFAPVGGLGFMGLISTPVVMVQRLWAERRCWISWCQVGKFEWSWSLVMVMRLGSDILDWTVSSDMVGGNLLCSALVPVGVGSC